MDGSIKEVGDWVASFSRVTPTHEQRDKTILIQQMKVDG